MKEIKNTFAKKVWTDSAFNLFFGLLLVLLYFGRINSWILLVAVLVYEVFIVSMIEIRLNKLNKILMQLTNEEIQKYQIIDNTIFFEDFMISYSYRKFVFMKYLEIKSIKGSKGFGGSQKILIESNIDIIVISTKNESAIENALNILEKKNKSIALKR